MPIERNGKYPRMIAGRLCVGERHIPLLPLADPEKIFLSPRQQTILREIADNETTIGIALKYKISPKTVEYHRAELMWRLGVNGIAALTKLAIKVGLTNVDD